MPESKMIPTSTEVRTSSSGSPNVEIYTFYDPGYYHLISCFLAETTGTILGTSYIEGDLVCTMRDSPTKIDIQYDNFGNLIIFALSGEDYEFDEDGNIIGTVDI